MAFARVIIPSATISTILLGFLVAVPFASGWEVYNSIEALTFDTLPGKTVAADCKVYNNEDGTIIQAQLPECAPGPSNWRIDTDHQYYGWPSLFLEVSPVKHTNLQGAETDSRQEVQSRQTPIGRDVYYWDYHVFMFTFLVKTEADARVIHDSGFLGTKVYQHETSFTPNGFSQCVSGSVGCGVGGAEVAGGAFVTFAIKPWQGIREPAEGTIRFGQWAGIMQAIVFEVEAGRSQPEIQETVPGYGINVLDRNAAANMFTLQGGGQPNADFSTAALDARIPQAVLIELPFKLFPGAEVRTRLGGGVESLVPTDYFIRYKMRVDVVIVTAWTPQLDFIDDNANGVLDPGEFSYIDENENNQWDLGVDEAVSGTAPTPPPPTCDLTSDFTIDNPDGTRTRTKKWTCTDGSTRTETNNETIGSQEDDGLDVGIGIGDIEDVGDFRSPGRCEFWNLSCLLNNAFNFPSVGAYADLFIFIAVIALIVFGASIFLGRRRGR